jgi:hypothetical protein
VYIEGDVTVNKKLLTSLAIIAAIAIVAMGSFLFLLNNHLSTANNTISIQDTQINGLQSDLLQVKDELETTTTNLNSIAQTLEEATNNLSSTKLLLTEKTTELEKMTSEKLTLKVSVSNLTTRLDDANEMVDALNKSIDLYKDTFGQVYQNTTPFTYVFSTEPPSWSFSLSDTVTPKRLMNLIENTDAINPTYEKLITFLRNDKTDMNRYLLDYYVCGNYAETVHNNAEAAGIRAALVLIDFEEGPGHAINAFLTTDKGLVYIDCTGSDTQGPSSMDGLVSGLKINATYHESFLFPSYYVFTPNTTKITGIEIYW